MLALLFLLASAFWTGFRVVDLLSLPTRALRWSIGATVGCAQIIGSVQALSLFDRLEAVSLLLLSLGIALGVGALSFLRKRVPPAIPSEVPASPGPRGLCREVGVSNVALVLVALLLWLSMTFVAPWVIPAGDPYHVTMCLAWIQHRSIEAFPVYDPRVVGVIFGSEALAFPGFLYLGSPALFVLFSAAAAVGNAMLVYSLTRSAGATRKLATFVAALFLASAPMLRSVWAAQSDFLLSTFWLLTSLLCLVEARKSPHRAIVLLACGAFTFAMACGAKNTILLHGPAYALAAVVLLGRVVFRIQAIVVAVSFGLLGALGSGVIWSYMQNARHFGDWRGPDFLRNTLAKEYTPAAAWTRLARTLVTSTYDCGWLPNSVQPAYFAFTRASLRVIGAKDELQEDSDFYSFDPKYVRPGNGFGILGPLMLLPALVCAVYFILPRRRKYPDGDVVYQALAVFAILSFLTFCIVLRTQRIGISRLMLSAVAAIFPLTIVMFRFRSVRWLAVTAVMLSAAMTVAQGAVFALNRHAPNAFPRLMALKRMGPAECTIRWRDRPVEMMVLREPYTSRELHAAVESIIQTPTAVGFIAGCNAEGFRCFGSNYSNRVYFLNDYPSGKFTPAPAEVRYIFVEDFDVSSIPAEELEGFTPVFQASFDGQWRFAVFERVVAE